MTERAERELSHMRDQQQVCQTRVEELTRELSRLMSEINRHRKEHGNLADLKTKLQKSGECGISNTTCLFAHFSSNAYYYVVN